MDIIFAHRFDFTTPMEEICRAFSWTINKGLAFYWGTSEWPVERIVEAIKICEKLNLHPPVVEQCQYNALMRDRFEHEYRALFE